MVSKVFSREKPDSGTRVSEGETGWEEIWDAREVEEIDGD